MSNQMLNEVLADQRTKGSVRMVLVVLADMANERGECWPGHGTIAKRANISRRSAFTAIAWLQEHGFLLVKRRRRASRHHESNLYLVRIPEACESKETSAPAASHNPSGETAVPGEMLPEYQGSAVTAPGVVQSEHQGSADTAPGVVQPEHQGSAVAAPKSLINPQLNQEEEEEERPPGKNIFQLYEQNIGTLTPLMADNLKDVEQTYPITWIDAAFRQCVYYNRRDWSYVDAILQRWKRDGFGADSRKKPGRDRSRPRRHGGENYAERLIHWADKQPE